MYKYLARILKMITAMMNAFYSVFTRADEKTAMFISFHGKGYSDSPKAIYEQMRKDPRCADFTFVWVLKKGPMKEIDIPGAIKVEYLSPQYFKWLYRAKYWIFNCKMPEYLKKGNRIYMQTWHGTPLKRLGFDQQDTGRKEYYRAGDSFEAMARSYEADSKRYDFMISANKFSTRVFQTGFHVKPEQLAEIGYPRNDYFINADEAEKMRIRRELGIPDDKKVLFYAPTWRDNTYNMKGYTFELKADFHRWKEMIGDEWVLVYKPHYLIVSNLSEEEKKSLEDFLYDIPAAEDIAPYYVIADAMVTDYSSVFFDYSVLGRPTYFYMYDLKEYAEELRGFYLDINTDIPGDIYTDEAAMLKDIKDGVYDYERLERFNREYNEFNRGDSSERAVDLILGVKR